MQSKRSFFSFALYRKGILRFWPIWTVYTFFMVLFLPIGAGKAADRAARYSAADEVAEAVNTYILEAIVGSSLVLIFLAVIFAAVALFSYLYATRSTVFYHSLPIRREGLFITNYLTGITFFIVPNVICALITVVACAARGIPVGWSVGQWLIGTTVIVLLFFSFAVLCTMATGQKVMLPILYVIFNFYLSVIVPLFHSLCEIFLYGMMYSSDLDGLSVFCPIIHLPGLSQSFHFSPVKGCSGGLVYDNAGLFVMYALAAVVLAAVALLAYKRRNIECAGDIVSMKWLRPLFCWGVAISGMLSFGLILCEFLLDMNSSVYDNRLWVSLICTLTAIVFFFAAQMIVRKSFKVFKRCYREAFVLTFLIGLVFVGLGFDAIGFEKRIPAPEKVESVTVYAGYIYTFDNPDDIQAVIQAQRTLIEQYKNDELPEYAEFQYNVDIIYSMNDGDEIRRSYDFPVSKELLSLVGSPAQLIESVCSSPENIKKSVLPEYLSEDTVIYAELYTDTIQETFTREQAAQLYQAVIRDIEAGNIRGFGMFGVYEYEPISTETWNSLGFYYPDAGMGYWNLDFSSKCENILDTLRSFGVKTDIFE